MIAAPFAVALGWVSLLVPYLALTVVTGARQGIDASVLLRVCLYESGHILLLALTTSAGAWLWARFVPERLRRWDDLVLALVAVGVALALLPPDMAGFLARQRSAGSGVPWTTIVVAAAALALLIAANLRRLPRWLRVLVLLGAMIFAGVQRSIQPLDYLGAHAFLSWLAATSIAAALLGATWPTWVTRVSARNRLAALAALWIAALSSIAFAPSRTVWAQMNRLPGAPLVANLSTMRTPALDPPSPAELGPWWQSRDAQPAIEPSRPRLLGGDTVVILITIDALRADVVNSRSHDELLPTLSRLRDESVGFTQARTPSPSTLTSITSMFSGLYYSQIYWTKNETERWGGRIFPHEDESTRFPELLNEHGVRTVHLLADHGLDHSTRVSAGFETIRKTARNNGHAQDLMALFLDELGKLEEGPAFLYGHFLDPHAPYNRAGKEGTLYERYLREVALVDEQLGRLMSFLEQSGLAERTLLIISADHGEGFREHGTNYHARSLYDELLRVPLMFRHPVLEPRSIDADVGLIDLGATILDLMGVATPGQFMGQSLVAFLRGEEIELERPMAADSGRRMQALIFEQRIKVIVDLQRRTQEIYDLRADPGEQHNLVDEPSFPAEQYLQGLELFFEAHTLKRPGGYTPPARRF